MWRRLRNAGGAASSFLLPTLLITPESQRLPLRDYVIEAEKHGEEIVAPTAIESVDTPHGCALVSIPMIRLSGRSVRANLSLDEGVAAFIDSEAARCGMTRTTYVEWMARRVAQMGG